MKNFDQDPTTIVTHAFEGESYYNSVTPPIAMTSLHVYDTMEEYKTGGIDRFFYGRVSNPTVRIVERKIAALEHGLDCVSFSSGMAAATSVVDCVCKAGSHVVCVSSVYGPLREYLEVLCIEKYNMIVTFVDGRTIEEFEAVVTDKTDLIVLESPSSIVFRLQDLRKVSKLAKKHGAKTYIDNTYCSPLLQNPIDLGIDFVMHTMSKYLGGHSDIIGGAIVCNSLIDVEKVLKQRELRGGILGPMEGWLVLRGMRTLNLRIKAAQETGMMVANFLEKHEKVYKVYYSGLPSHAQYELAQKQQRGNGSLMSFELKASLEETEKFVDRLKIFQIGCSWGGHESLALVVSSKWSNEKCCEQGTSNKLVRIYCGLEDANILITALDEALNEVCE